MPHRKLMSIRTAAEPPSNYSDPNRAWIPIGGSIRASDWRDKLRDTRDTIGRIIAPLIGLDFNEMAAMEANGLKLAMIPISPSPSHIPEGFEKVGGVVRRKIPDEIKLTSRSYEEAASWMRQHGYDMEPPLDDASAAALAKRWDSAQDVYLRYGDIPQSGKSMNFATHSEEPGVSVFSGKYIPETGEAFVTKAHPETLAALQRTSRPLYVVSGEPVGRGSGAEPLLRNARVIARVKSDLTPGSLNLRRVK